MPTITDKPKANRRLAAPQGSASSAEQWTPADKWLPPDPEPVLAWDGGTHYIASYDGQEWFDCSTEEPIDCYITHWRWLDVPADE